MAKKHRLGNTIAFGSLIGAMGVAVPYQAMAADTLEGALKESTTKLSLRPRYEKVDTDGGMSEALTLKTRLTYTTGSFFDVSAVLEFDDVKVEVVKAVHGYVPYLKGDKKISMK